MTAAIRAALASGLITDERTARAGEAAMSDIVIGVDAGASAVKSLAFDLDERFGSGDDRGLRGRRVPPHERRDRQMGSAAASAGFVVRAYL